jgi:hypothetical protein
MDISKDDSVTTNFEEFEKIVPDYQNIDTHQQYKNVTKRTLQYLKIALEDINQLWEELNIDYKIKNGVTTYDRYYGDIEDMCRQAKLIQSVRLNVECSLQNFHKINKEKGE